MRFKPVSRKYLGVSALLASVSVTAGCSGGSEVDAPEASETSEAQAAAAEAPALPAAGSSTGGEGEGGVDTSQAAFDPVIFRAALAVAEAHVLAANDAYAAGKQQDAASMFAHPVGEVLADMEEPFAARGVAPFNDLFIDASQATLEGAAPGEVAQKTTQIRAAIRAAEVKAPASSLSEAQIAARVVADQIDRAAYMYPAAKTSDRYEAYLDGYGFYHAAQEAFLRSRDAIALEIPETEATLRESLDVIARAYPGALPPETLALDTSEVTAAASRALLAAN